MKLKLFITQGHIMPQVQGHIMPQVQGHIMPQVQGHIMTQVQGHWKVPRLEGDVEVQCDLEMGREFSVTR